ncbi:P-loop containing nucleoside triphosphate hydrolase protein [Lobosporangium transversale]|uniref:Kinesin-like protein n=1 Tax=Lobosporangium transversale TaxID=64571 RepID=A0A1Y2GNQ5_9FUNG|nr:P-loop containing nucleoside triphosphate hydrolase protein [Lobosporangium transversale]ORZ16729.1 P-loop containing nucleoside triphosphate hydrolase protein [Lobosporangium transversale]|eukprot:XP_021881664.1 P-loop containing nucleoside triphosphate hydrolase protein [Lobosporangium transversale]
MARAKALGRNASSSTASDMTAKIRVCVRKRPLNSKEINKGEKDMATVLGCQLAVDEPKVRVDMTKYIERHNFIFDDVFDSDATNEDVYRRTAYPLVQYLFEGGKATCFAYGQTGSGKTFTMLDDKQGLYVLAARDIFIMLRKPEHSHLSAYIGFYEIYQGHLYDLLNNRKRLNPREDGKSNVVISGLKEYEIVNVQGLMQVFEYGNNVRSTGSTNANADSSRSHAIMQIVLKNRANKSVEGKLSFIDLAGSERGADRGETDVKTRMEGAEINKSLLALKECIRALDQDKKHTPFRQSKLTQVLKDSFVGNSRTCMVATISPNNSNSEHTLNTLRYADR